MGVSWSKTRKRLEQDFLCEKLRGRVQYFFTVYHDAPDRYGRFAIRADGEEIFQANPYNEAYQNEYFTALHQEEHVPFRQWDGHRFLFEEENREMGERAALLAIRDGKADSYDVSRSIHTYLNQGVAESLASENLLLRMFAVLDRRTGRRTLEKLVDSYQALPEWLQRFYRLRFAAEGIAAGEKEER